MSDGDGVFKMGGQLADTGLIEKGGFVFEVRNVQKNKGGKFMHSGVVKSGVAAVGDTVTVAYDPKDPNKMIQPMDIVFPMIFASIGVASLVGGIISFIRTYNKRKALKEREKEWQ